MAVCRPWWRAFPATRVCAVGKPGLPTQAGAGGARSPGPGAQQPCLIQLREQVRPSRAAWAALLPAHFYSCLSLDKL